jgi:hypothetical protein
MVRAGRGVGDTTAILIGRSNDIRGCWFVYPWCIGRHSCVTSCLTRVLCLNCSSHCHLTKALFVGDCSHRGAFFFTDIYAHDTLTTFLSHGSHACRQDVLLVESATCKPTSYCVATSYNVIMAWTTSGLTLGVV